MKYLKTYKLFENNNFPTDHEEIRRICEKYKITNYTINEDGSVDVDGRVNLYGSFEPLSEKRLTRLPLKFGKVGGDFWCNNNKLTSLEGCPYSVGGDFDCRNNQLITLEGCPSSVGGLFACTGNKLTSLEGFPDKVSGLFLCDEPFKTLIGFFHGYNDFKDSIEDYGWLDGNQINWVKFKDVIEDETYVKPGTTVPDEIEGFEFTYKM